MIKRLSPCADHARTSAGMGQEWLQKLITKFPIQECNCHWCLQPLFKKNRQALAQENEITQRLACL